MQFDPYFYSSTRGFVDQQAKGPCKYLIKSVAGPSWYSGNVYEAQMTSAQYQSCLTATRNAPYRGVAATISSTRDRDSWLVTFGGKGRSASFGSAVGTAAAAGVGKEVVEEIGNKILSSAGTLVFFVVDVAKVAIDATCYAQTSSAGKASIEQLLAVGGRFFYEQRVVPGMATNNRPALVQTAYYRTFVGDPGTGVGEWRVVPLYASAVAVTVK